MRQGINDLGLEAGETVNGVRCYRLYSSERGMTFWVDQKTMLLRRIEEVSDVPSRKGGAPIKTIERTTYKPVLNSSIDDSRFKK